MFGPSNDVPVLELAERRHFDLRVNYVTTPIRQQVPCVVVWIWFTMYGKVSDFARVLVVAKQIWSPDRTAGEECATLL
jgi:hypothetical protein